MEKCIYFGCVSQATYICECNYNIFICSGHISNHLQSSAQHVIKRLDSIAIQVNPQYKKNLQTKILNLIKQINQLRNNITSSTEKLIIKISKETSSALKTLNNSIKCFEDAIEKIGQINAIQRNNCKTKVEEVLISGDVSGIFNYDLIPQAFYSINEENVEIKVENENLKYLVKTYFEENNSFYLQMPQVSPPAKKPSRFNPNHFLI